MAPIVLLRLFRADSDFNLAALNPAYPIKRQPSAQRTQASQGVDNEEPPPLDPIREQYPSIRDVESVARTPARAVGLPSSSKILRQASVANPHGQPTSLCVHGVCTRRSWSEFRFSGRQKMP